MDADFAPNRVFALRDHDFCSSTESDKVETTMGATQCKDRVNCGTNTESYWGSTQF
jgi:hypothetical protein